MYTHLCEVVLFFLVSFVYRLVKIKEWITANDRHAVCIPFSGCLELKVCVYVCVCVCVCVCV